MAGFFPESWEYIKALCYPDWESGWFSENVVEKTLPSYPLENAVMIHVHNIVSRDIAYKTRGVDSVQAS